MSSEALRTANPTTRSFSSPFSFGRMRRMLPATSSREAGGDRLSTAVRSSPESRSSSSISPGHAMRRIVQFLEVGALIAVVGCANNSDRRYADSAIEPGGPLASYMLALDAQLDAIDEGDVDPATLEADAVAQLEDLVETAASRLAGSPFDYPTPDIGHIDFAAEVGSRRDIEDYAEWYYGALYDGDCGYGVKYLLDHAGKDHAAAALDHPEAKDLAMAVDGYVLDITPERQSIEVLREVEQRIWKSLGLTEEQWFANERIYDSAIDVLGAYSEPAHGCFFFRRCRIEIPQSMFGSSILEIIHTYGHELLHCRVGEFESLGEENRTIEETACEVFGARVVDELIAMKRIDFDVDERIFGPKDQEDLRRVIDEVARNDGAEDSDDDEGTDDYAEVEAEFGRLRQLYRSRDITFERWRRTQARYGYVELDAKPVPEAESPDVYAQLESLFDRFGVDAVAQLIPVLSDHAALARVMQRASSSKATVDDLLAAARSTPSTRVPAASAAP